MALSTADKKEIIALITTVQTKNLNSGNRRFCTSSLLGIEDTPSVNLEGGDGSGTPLTASLKLSPDVGNTAEIRANGLWIPGDGGTSYSDEQARDAVGAMFNNTEFSVNDALNTIGLNQVPFAKITGVPAFLTSFSETDPVFSSSVAASITNPDLAAWNGAVAALPAIDSDIAALQAAAAALQEDIDDNDIVTAAFTGTSTKTLTLTKGDGSTVTANFNDTGVNDTLYATDGSLPGPRVINMQGFSVHWQNNGLFRISEGNVTVGAVYDFNDGIDFLNYDATYSANIRQNSVTGIQLTIMDVVGALAVAGVDVTPTGIKLTGIPEHADNAAALVAGLTAGYLYRTGDNLKIVH